MSAPRPLWHASRLCAAGLWILLATANGLASPTATPPAVAPAAPAAATGSQGAAAATAGQAAASLLPSLELRVGGNSPGTAGAGASETVKLFALLTVLSLAPSIVILLTSFVRIIIVFHFVRQAIGLPNVPPNQVLAGLALILTLHVMNPVGVRLYDEAFVPLQNGQINVEQAYERAAPVLRAFLAHQTRQTDLALMSSMSGASKPATLQDVPLGQLVPAFLLSELKTGFQMGFFIYLPFLVVELVVASVLLSMGMMMVPPATISLPFKVLLFVLADGWSLVCESLIRSFT
jgi:flagellar biosynthesis protein FliP